MTETWVACRSSASIVNRCKRWTSGKSNRSSKAAAIGRRRSSGRCSLYQQNESSSGLSALNTFPTKRVSTRRAKLATKSKALVGKTLQTFARSGVVRDKLKSWKKILEQIEKKLSLIFTKIAKVYTGKLFERSRQAFQRTSNSQGTSEGKTGLQINSELHLRCFYHRFGHRLTYCRTGSTTVAG